MTQLHTIVARERSVRTRVREELTSLYHTASHAPTFMGGVKGMESLNEDDVPSEMAEVALPAMTADRVFQRIRTILAEAWDLTATRDRSNQDARADIVVDGQTRATDVPLPTLLSLEKQLEDLRTVIKNMPVRDPSKTWTFDEDQGFHRGPERRTATTRKRSEVLTLAAATDRFPAQAQAVNVDKVIGHYVTVEFSGAPSRTEREEMVTRLDRLIDAVKTARTEANRVEVTDMRIAPELLDYVFAPRVGV